MSAKVNAMTSSERVKVMRASRAAIGLKRLELYAHPDDWPAIKAQAERIQADRDRKSCVEILKAERQP